MGLMSVIGFLDGELICMGIVIGDFSLGMWVVIGVMVVLFECECIGCG